MLAKLPSETNRNHWKILLHFAIHYKSTDRSNNTIYKQGIQLMIQSKPFGKQLSNAII